MVITSKTRQIFIDSGLETPETIEKWNEKYEHYVPLHRDVVGGSTTPRIGQGFNIRGREPKRATGLNREVTDIIAHVVAQHEAAIVSSEKDMMDCAQVGELRPTAEVWGYYWGYLSKSNQILTGQYLVLIKHCWRTVQFPPPQLKSHPSRVAF
jgi:hypothetical protein